MISRTLNTNIQSIKFKNEHIVYENFIKCTIKDYEFNLSYNPTLLSGSQGAMVPFSSSVGGDIFYINSGSNYGILKDIYTSSISGSEFSPYVSTIGLYNEANDLLAIAKMAAPMPLSSNTDVTFLVKWDTKWNPKPYFTPSVTPTRTPTPTPSVTPTITPTPSITTTPSITPSITPSPQDCNMVGNITYPPPASPSVTPTVTVSRTPTPTPTVCCAAPTITSITNQNPTTQTATVNYTVTGCGTCGDIEYQIQYQDDSLSSWTTVTPSGCSGGSIVIPYDPLSNPPKYFRLRKNCGYAVSDYDVDSVTGVVGTSTWYIQLPTYGNGSSPVCQPSGLPSSMVCCPIDIQNISFNEYSYAVDLPTCGIDDTFINPNNLNYYTNNNSILIGTNTVTDDVKIFLIRNGGSPTEICYSGGGMFFNIPNVYIEPGDSFQILLACCQPSYNLC